VIVLSVSLRVRGADHAGSGILAMHTASPRARRRTKRRCAAFAEEPVEKLWRTPAARCGQPVRMGRIQDVVMQGEQSRPWIRIYHSGKSTDEVLQAYDCKEHCWHVLRGAAFLTVSWCGSRLAPLAQYVVFRDHLEKLRFDSPQNIAGDRKCSLVRWPVRRLRCSSRRPGGAFRGHPTRISGVDYRHEDCDQT
jgi:hypothetical protein